MPIAHGSRWFKSRARNVPTAHTAAALQFRIRVLFGPVGLTKS